MSILTDKPEHKSCPFCDQQVSAREEFATDNLYCSCPNCGKYAITGIAFSALKHDLERDPDHHGYEYSGAILELNETGHMPPLITTENYRMLLDQVVVPKKPAEKLAKILLYVYRRTHYLYEDVNIRANMLAVGYAQHVQEFNNLLQALVDMGKFDLPPADSRDYHLTLAGFSDAERISGTTDSRQCFVAMWFDDEMVDVFRRSITAAVEATGHKAIIVSMKQHNDDITDHIIAEIRKSRFIIADFTGLRGGVYYEAGFAAGLGKPVIMTCRDDWFNTSEQRNVHFDVSHMNFIVWKDGADLGQRLLDRIVATIT